MPDLMFHNQIRHFFVRVGAGGFEPPTSTTPL